jgi:hypothetical protein
MYEGLPIDARASIDAAFEDLTKGLRGMNYGTDNCDHAEHLIDAMTEYFLYSNPAFRSVVYAAACHYEATGEYAEGCGG